MPWHQDNAYLDPSGLYTLMPTAWIPLLDANKTNGCMQVKITISARLNLGAAEQTFNISWLRLLFFQRYW